MEKSKSSPSLSTTVPNPIATSNETQVSKDKGKGDVLHPSLTLTLNPFLLNASNANNLGIIPMSVPFGDKLVYWVEMTLMVTIIQSVEMNLQKLNWFLVMMEIRLFASYRNCSLPQNKPN